MSDQFMCPRCAADPQPEDFGSPRKCAFLEDGTFTPKNWNCATIDVVMNAWAIEIEGVDEHMEVVPVPAEWASTNGWIVLTRYKRRGCTSSAVHVGDFWPPRPLTWAVADQVATAEEQRHKPGKAAR